MARAEQAIGGAPRQPAKGRRKDWRQAGLAAWREFQEDHIPLIAAGISFYSLLAFFPALAAISSLYGLIADVGDAHDQIRALAAILPADVVDFLGDQMVRAAAARPQGLTLALAGGLILSVWSANGAVSALMLGLNIAYEETEKRNWLMRTLVSLALTFGGLLFVVLLLGTSVGVTIAYNLAGTSGALAYEWARIGALIAGLIIAVSLIYRYGPSRHRSKWRLIGLGPLLVTLVWFAATMGLSAYLGAMAHYADKYGPVGAVLAFMMWTFVSALILLAGAELDAELAQEPASSRKP